MKFEIFKESGQFYFHIKAGNNKIVAQSEGYPQRKSALKAIKAIKKGAGTAKVVELD